MLRTHLFYPTPLLFDIPVLPGYLALFVGASPVIIEYTAPLETLRARIWTRTAAGVDDSDADLIVLESQLIHFEPLVTAERRIAMSESQSVVSRVLTRTGWLPPVKFYFSYTRPWQTGCPRALKGNTRSWLSSPAVVSNTVGWKASQVQPREPLARCARRF